MPEFSTRRWSPRVRSRSIEVTVAGQAVLTLLPSDRRVRVGLPMPGLDRSVDVTVQPTAALRALSEAARAAHLDDRGVEATAREALTRAAEAADAWLPEREMPLASWFGGVAFPLLGAAYDYGAVALTEVPRWAEPVLAAASFGEGARVAFEDRATRPVRQALVEALRPIPSGQISLGVLALGLMGRTALQPDRIARVLRCERALHPTSDLPDPDVLNSACRVLNQWGAQRAERLLIEAAANADGLKLLLTTISYANQLGDHGPTSRLPNQLAELHDAYRVLVPTAAGPINTPRGSARATRNPTGHQTSRGGPVGHHPVLPARTVSIGLEPTSRFDLPAVYRALDGSTVDDMKFLLPRTVQDLTRWGRILRNCLDDFGASVLRGESVIVGVTRDERLIYAVEIIRGGVVRQFNGWANRPPSPRDRQAVIGALARAGAINPQRAGNRGWMDGVDLRHQLQLPVS